MPNVELLNMWNRVFKKLLSRKILIQFLTVRDFVFFSLHCDSGKDLWLTLATDLWLVMRLNWQFAAHGWFKLESPDLVHNTIPRDRSQTLVREGLMQKGGP